MTKKENKFLGDPYCKYFLTTHIRNLRDKGYAYAPVPDHSPSES